MRMSKYLQMPMASYDNHQKDRNFDPTGMMKHAGCYITHWGFLKCGIPNHHGFQYQNRLILDDCGTPILGNLHTYMYIYIYSHTSRHVNLHTYIYINIIHMGYSHIFSWMWWGPKIEFHLRGRNIHKIQSFSVSEAFKSSQSILEYLEEAFPASSTAAIDLCDE